MRIGIEFLYAQEGTTQGYDAAVRNLLAGLERVASRHDYVVFCSSAYYQQNRARFKCLQLVECRGNWHNRLRRALWMTGVLPRLARQFHLDGIYFPTHFRPLQSLKPIWTTFSVYDLQFRYTRASFGRVQQWVREFYYRLSLFRSDRDICPSEFVSSTVGEQYPWVPQARLAVLPIPVEFGSLDGALNEAKPKHWPQKPYLLTVGKHFPHKNFETLIRAFAILRESIGYAGQLVIVGSPTAHTPGLRRLAQTLKLGDQVNFIGYTSDAARNQLYVGADAFVFPSLYEGFGMPAIEAMGRGVPVICSRTTSLPEITLGLATYYAAATDAAALAQAMAQVLAASNSGADLAHIAEQVRERYASVTVARDYVALWDSLEHPASSMRS